MEKQKSDKEIIEHYGMANLPLIISELYKKYGTKFELIDIGGDCMFRIGQTNNRVDMNSEYYKYFFRSNVIVLRMKKD